MDEEGGLIRQFANNHNSLARQGDLIAMSFTVCYEDDTVDYKKSYYEGFM